MKRLALMIFLALSLSIILTNCDKENDINEIDGTYVGTYTYTNLTDDIRSQTPTIELTNGKYTYSGFSDADDGMFDRGSGNFTITGNKILFELIYYYIPEGYTPITIDGFDHWFLKGEYEYTFDGKKLILSKTATVNSEEYSYEFKLNKKTKK